MSDNHRSPKHTTARVSAHRSRSSQRWRQSPDGRIRLQRVSLPVPRPAAPFTTVSANDIDEAPPGEAPAARKRTRAAPKATKARKKPRAQEESSSDDEGRASSRSGHSLPLCHSRTSRSHHLSHARNFLANSKKGQSIMDAKLAARKEAEELCKFVDEQLNIGPQVISQYAT